MRTHTHNHAAPRRRRGFTLIELLVVISIIALVATIVMPGMVGLFKAGSQGQALSILRSMLGAARGVAIEKSCYTAVHIQIGKDNACWAAILVGVNDGEGGITFKQLPGYAPQRMPGNLAFGEIPTAYDNYKVVAGGSGKKTWVYQSNRQWNGPQQGGLTAATSHDFLELTVVFTPNGTITDQIDDKDIVLTNDRALWGDRETAIWPSWGQRREPGVPERAVRTMVFFDYKEFKQTRWGVFQMKVVLERRGQWLMLNNYTGQILEEH